VIYSGSLLSQLPHDFLISSHIKLTFVLPNRYTRFRQQMEGHVPSRRPRITGGAKRGPKPKRPRPNDDDPVSTKKEEGESQKMKTESQEGDEDNTDADGELDEVTSTPFSGGPEIEHRVERLRGSTASTSLSPVLRVLQYPTNS
jgi:hypothetical protein